MAKKPKAPTKELTREEQIYAAYQKTKETSDLMHEEIVEVAPQFRVQIGDAVEVGNLEDCLVVGIFDDGKFIVIEYTHTYNNYG